ncbi:vWA domain-containing protein [Vibrio algarum]|uniref:VWA domain-containing protein n=1 Tax=Vibrio algarum TaxID=3020714 RepID=A0ABT4YW05_9VIBR|nr:VWA domain-containing protein [Vibrio sp. KJ40-1]MDB1125768.1 VWA domain-containing protein [Vibrio sp. KJ40-1]
MTLGKITTVCAALTMVMGCSDKLANEQDQASSSKKDQAVIADVIARETKAHAIQEQEIYTVATLERQSKSKISNQAVRAMPASQMDTMLRIEPPVYNQNRDNYLESVSNNVHQVINAPLSTFSIDVDTGSYTNVRSYLNMGQKPPVDAIREEAFINYFDYQYAPPENKDQPFSVNTEIAPSPWNETRQLLRIALKGYDIPHSERKPSNLVFLVDVSGSMNDANKLPLLVRSLSMLVKELSENDSVSLVTYAGHSSVVLKPTKGNEKETIINALKNLTAGGGTYGESGITMAYQQARASYIENGVNRIILATDGDFNVGVTSIDALKETIATERKQGISLTTIGFGRGNYNDAMMEQLANIGDGNHAYIDTLHEAKKVLLRQMSGTLQTIASDVKIQIEFNPDIVKEYRLIGYQNRMLKDEDFNNDKVDAGEIGAGHTVTALYELTLAGSKGQIDDLRYGAKTAIKPNFDGEVAQVKVRYKRPNSNDSTLISTIISSEQIKEQFSLASEDFQFASSVAAFAQKLKDNNYLNDLSYEQIADIARENRGNDPFNYRGEFISLVEVTQSL